MSKVKTQNSKPNLKSKIFFVSFLLLFSSVLCSLFSPTVTAECPSTDYDCQIKELQAEVDARKEAHEKNKIDLATYEKELVKVSQNLVLIGNKLKLTEKEILQREIELGVQKELLNARIRDLYKKTRNSSAFFILLSSRTASEFTQELGLSRAAANEDLRIISLLSKNISQLEQDKANLSKTQTSLSALKNQVDKQVDFYKSEVAKTETFFAQISAKQKEIEALKAGGFSTTVGDVPPADDPASRPDFNPGFSPAFAVFSFGYPHHKGMSQYGAYGRAKAGQSAEDILHAYYGAVEIKKDYDSGRQISVRGYGRMDIETYTKRIYEIPNSWGDNGGFEALKAQAVAARTYALAWTREGTGGAICTDQGCQVYKNANKGGKWEEAVNATRGWVLVKDGKLISSWYASTSGGYQVSYNALEYLKNGSIYSTPGFWDTTGGREKWADGAYEKLAGSPWFYKAWYRLDNAICGGKNHPWLTSLEMADILNAWQVLFKGIGEVGRIYPLDGCGGGNPYSRSELQSLGGFTEVTEVNQVVYGGDGSTISVGLSTNKGNITIPGSEFKKAFNLRAPGYIGIKSSLFDIRRK